MIKTLFIKISLLLASLHADSAESSRVSHSQDELIHILERGVNLGRTYTVSFYHLLPSYDSAKEMTRELNNTYQTLKIDVKPNKISGSIDAIVSVNLFPTHENIQCAQSVFCSLAEKYGGQGYGWGFE